MGDFDYEDTSLGDKVTNRMEAVANTLQRRLSIDKNAGLPHVNSMSKKQTDLMESWSKRRSRSIVYSSKSGVSEDSPPAADEAGFVVGSLSSSNAVFALHLLKNGRKVDKRLIQNMKNRMAIYADVVKEFDNVSSSHFKMSEVQALRKSLLEEVGCAKFIDELERMENGRLAKNSPPVVSTTVTAFCKDIYFSAIPSLLASSSETYSKLRKLVRLGTSKLFTVPAIDSSKISIRHWFIAKGLQTRPEFTCSLVCDSDILMGQGPNGGHMGCEDLPGGDATSQAEEESHFNHLTRHLKELWMSGNDINRFFFNRVSRDDEVVGFLNELKNMKVGTVIANGYPRAYTMTNMKIMCSPAPYADSAFFSRPGFQNLSRGDDVYRHSTPRDFFNYFGAEDGDDGLPWWDVGDGTRVCNLEGHKLTSRLLRKVKNSTGSQIDIYRLTFSTKKGCFCASSVAETEFTIMNVRTWDQAPALLSAEQVSVLCDHLVSMNDDEFNYVFIHCAGGIGRTGDLAYALSELLCEKVPNDPLEKVQWLRSQRPGCIQTAEQLADGMILSHMLLAEMVKRSKKRNGKK